MAKITLLGSSQDLASLLCAEPHGDCYACYGGLQAGILTGLSKSLGHANRCPKAKKTAIELEVANIHRPPYPEVAQDLSKSSQLQEPWAQKVRTDLQALGETFGSSHELGVLFWGPFHKSSTTLCPY